MLLAIALVIILFVLCLMKNINEAKKKIKSNNDEIDLKTFIVDKEEAEVWVYRNNDNNELEIEKPEKEPVLVEDGKFVIADYASIVKAHKNHAITVHKPHRVGKGKFTENNMNYFLDIVDM